MNTCQRCHKPRKEHRADERKILHCADGKVMQFRRVAASQSFTAGEVEVLHEMLKAAQWNNPLSTVIVCNPSFAKLARKIHKMRDRIAKVKSDHAVAVE